MHHILCFGKHQNPHWHGKARMAASAHRLSFLVTRSRQKTATWHRKHDSKSLDNGESRSVSLSCLSRYAGKSHITRRLEFALKGSREPERAWNDRQDAANACWSPACHGNKSFCEKKNTFNPWNANPDADFELSNQYFCKILAQFSHNYFMKRLGCFCLSMRSSSLLAKTSFRIDWSCVQVKDAADKNVLSTASVSSWAVQFSLQDLFWWIHAFQNMRLVCKGTTLFWFSWLLLCNLFPLTCRAQQHSSLRRSFCVCQKGAQGTCTCWLSCTFNRYSIPVSFPF